VHPSPRTPLSLWWAAGAAAIGGALNACAFPALSWWPLVFVGRFVEFDDGRRRLGVVVASAEQGEALIAHLHRTMKDEDPRLFCFDVSTAKEARTIALP